MTDSGQVSYNALHVEGVQLATSTDRVWEVSLSKLHMAPYWLSGLPYVTQIAAHCKVHTDEWASICNKYCVFQVSMMQQQSQQGNKLQCIAGGQS